MVEEISDIRSMVELISLMVATESVVAACIPAICALISSVASGGLRGECLDL